MVGEGAVPAPRNAYCGDTLLKRPCTQDLMDGIESLSVWRTVSVV